MKSSQLKTPHSRLLFQSYSCEEVKDYRALISLALEQALALEQLILNKTRFQLANSYLYLYFDQPWSLQPRGHYRLGREVIGAPQRDYEGSYLLQDFAAFEVTSFSVPAYFSPHAPLELEQLVLPPELLQSGRLWRIEIEMGSLPPNLRLQFLPLAQGSR